MLGVWPALPIVIWNTENFTSDEDNIVAALEHRDRVCEVKLRHLTRLQLEKIVPSMQESFPALTKLLIESYQSRRDEQPVLPDSFLGGSAPRLRFLYLATISFRGLPKVLLSASNLLYLFLHGIPSGYIPPEMVAALSALTKLEDMRLVFGYPGPDSDSDSDLGGRATSQPTRCFLPALKSLELRGDGEYLDDFVARIDVPSINHIQIEFYNRPFFLSDFFHFPQFIGRLEKFRSFDYARINVSAHSTQDAGPSFSPKMDARSSRSVGFELLMRHRWTTSVSGRGLQHLISTPLQHRKIRIFFLEWILGFASRIQR